MTTTDPVEPCGSWRATRFIEGRIAEKQWCSRIEGDCPFPGTKPGQVDDNRRCGAEPGTVLRVRWADECIDEAYRNLFLRDASDAPEITDENYDVAVDALRACGATELSGRRTAS